MSGSGMQGAHGGLPFRHVDSRRRRGKVRVRIHEAGYHHASGGIDLNSVARLGKILDPATGSHLDQNATAN